MHTRTRRATRKKSAVGEEDETASNHSASPAPPLAVLLPDDILAAHDDLRSLLGVDVDLARPTSELLFTAYRVLLGVQEEARADIVRKDVELEQAIQDHESRVSELEAKLDESRQETEEERKKNAELAAANAALKSRLESMSSATSDNTALSRRVEEVEREKRDLLLALDRLREDSAGTEAELETVRTRLKETRAELATVQTEVAESKSTETTAKFKLETTTQELEILRTDHARLATSLSQKSEQLAALRRDTASQITTLQSEVSAAQSTTNSLNATIASLRSAHETLHNEHTATLEKLAQVQGDAGAERAQAKAQAEARDRLITLLEERNEEAVKRVREVEGEYEAVLERAERREHKLEAEREKAQARVEELEGVVRGFVAGDFAPGADASMSIGNASINLGAPGTPRAGTPAGIPSTPRNFGTPNPFATPSLLSPTAQLASRTQKGGKSYTEVYADYVRMSDELGKQKLETRRLEECLAGILRDIEERAPLLTEQRIEYERLQQTAADLTQQLADAMKAQESVRALEGERDTCKREVEVLEQQLADLSRQVVVLTREVAIRDDPSLADEEFTTGDDMDEDVSATDALITSELVLFRTLPELQSQNARLLRMTRELGARLEKEVANSNNGENLDAALREAGEVVERLEREVGSLNVRTESLKRERDAWKRVARGNGVPDPSAPATTASGREERVPAELVPARVDEELLKQLEERAKEAAQLREELGAAQRECGRLGAQLAKTTAQVTFLEEQRRLSAQTAEMQARELSEMQRRVREMQGSNTQLEIAARQAGDVAEEARATAEKLRNDAALLRAENDLWKKVEARLMDENKSLSRERTHLSELMRNLQTIQHEHERSGASEKRRLETDVKRLEADLESVRARLDKEADRNRATVLQKDSELRELQGKLDRVNDELAKTRETASVAENSRVHLQERVEGLMKEARSLGEKLAVYEGRAPGAPMPEGLSREQQLEIELGDVRAALKVAELDLESARGHVEQFKAISEASEQALREHIDTWDTYKEEQEALIARKDADINGLEERLRGLLDDFTKVSNERNQFQRDFEAQRTSFESEKRELEGVIADLSKVDNSAQAAHQSAQEDLRAQAALAQQANEKYERELLAHAEALKQINQLKSTINDLQKKVRNAKSSSETAAANLQASEASWARQKETMEKEVSELVSRANALQQQNALLHSQLEDVNTQAAKIRQTATAAAESLAIDSSDNDTDTKMQQLREVIAFVRKEKEIVDLQLHLVQVDNTRLKSENERLTVALDDARATLLKASSGPERAQAAEASVSSSQHAELVDKINQLNILRESNSTLRADAEANRKRAERLQGQLLRLKTEYEPIKLELVTVRAELEERQRQNEQFQTDIEQLKERFASHDRIDPEQLTEATAAKEAAEAKHQELLEQNEKQRNALKAWKDRYENFQTRSREEITKRNAQISQLEAEKTQVAETAQATTAELEQLKSELTQLQGDGSSDDGRVKALEEAKAKLQTLVDELTAKVASLEASAIAAVPMSVDGATEQQAQVAALQAELETLRSEKQALEAAQAGGSESTPATGSETLSKEKEQLETELAELRKKLQATENRVNRILTDAKSFRRGQLEAEKKVQQLTTELEAAKSNASPNQGETAADHSAEIEKAVAEATEKLRAELAAANENKEATTSEGINAIKSAHKEEIKKLNEEHAAKLTAAEAKAGEGGGAASEQALKAARDDGVSAGKKELASKLTLLERKLQNKDASIASLSARNAELEQLLKGSGATAPAATAVPASTSDAKAAPKRTGSVSNGTAAPASTNPPAKPAATEGAATGAGRGRGAAPARGAAPTRGAANARGTGTRGRGRGGMTGGSVLDGVNAVLGAAAATTAPSGGTSIAGAAKRPRESEGATAGEGGDLAKRLRSADAANAASKPAEAAASTTAAAPTRVLPPRNRQPPSTTQ